MTIRFPSGGAGVLSLTADILGTPLPQELTFFARFVPRGTSISGNVSIMSAGRWAAGSEFSMLTIGGTVLRAACRDGTNSQSAVATVALVAETEYKAIVSGSFGTSVTSKRAKLNGGTVATDATYVNMVLPGAFDRFRVGNRGFDSSLPFEGDLIEVAVWTTALSSTDEDLLAAGTSPASVSSGTLFDYWTFPSVAATYTGANGNVLTATGITSADTTAPTLSAASGTGGTLTCSGSVTTNEANGTLYAVVTGSATAPTAAQVKLGQDSTGTAALRVISQAVSATGAQSIASGAVTAGTRYLHFMHEDAATNRSTVVSSASFTVTSGGDTTAPTLAGSITVGTVTSSSIQITWPAGADDTAVASYETSPDGTNWTDRGNVLTYTFTSLTPSTSYTFRVRAKDAAANVSTPPIQVTQSTSGLLALTSSALKNNTGTLLTSAAAEAYVSNPTTGALVVKKTGLTSHATTGVITFSDAALTAATSYRVVWRLTATGAEGLETLTAT